MHESLFLPQNKNKIIMIFQLIIRTFLWVHISQLEVHNCEFTSRIYGFFSELLSLYLTTVFIQNFFCEFIYLLFCFLEEKM